ncbi:hypothetical protein BGZ97_009744 [Linnemannia gamsii]|uniref:Uncharacterized protein n=1 Tax=Linnemannia gamsii TaxID=64522 RepID=A0A9P6UPS8_9FUNG|nr:hypothetical protein BGZ97_009744 [Linnemannia gamsii]
MLRANPGLRRVWWAPDGLPLPVPKLDVEDFVGLGNLQELSLLYWDCHDGQLGEVLRIASRSLKKLTAHWVKVSRSSELTGSPIPPLSPQLEDSGSEGVTLSQLEYLEWRTNEPSGDFVFELIKRSPRLKTFTFEVHRVEWDFLRLADILRNHCPSLASLICSMELGVQEMENMLRHCSASGLRTVRVSVKDLDNGLIEAILQHASTVENLAISQERTGTGTDPARILQLLVGCSSLVRFSLVLRRSKLHRDLVNTLREQSWGCQDLQTLELIVVDSEEDRRQAEEGAVLDNEKEEEGEEKWYDVLAAKGWEVPAMVERSRLGDASMRRVAKTKLYRVLELIQYQNLDKLESLRLDNVHYCRSSTRPL